METCGRWPILKKDQKGNQPKAAQASGGVEGELMATIRWQKKVQCQGDEKRTGGLK